MFNSSISSWGCSIADMAWKTYQNSIDYWLVAKSIKTPGQGSHSVKQSLPNWQTALLTACFTDSRHSESGCGCYCVPQGVCWLKIYARW